MGIFILPLCGGVIGRMPFCSARIGILAADLRGSDADNEEESLGIDGAKVEAASRRFLMPASRSSKAARRRFRMI